MTTKKQIKCEHLYRDASDKRFCVDCGKRITQTYGEMKAFTVNSKDLFDKKKNPNLSLSPREILKNKKIKKRNLK